MQSKIVSEHFNNEYFLIHKEYSKDDLLSQFQLFINSIFDYSFNDKELLFQAFTHKSFAHEVKAEISHNERLEFLGDSVLQMVISQELYRRFEMLDEGALSKLRSAIVNENTLAKLGNFYQLNQWIMVGKGELKNKGHQRDSLISDCLEALIGAIYLDSDFITARDVLLSLIEKYEKQQDKIIDQGMILDFDAKSRLQELVMEKFKTTPKYISEQIEKDQFAITLMINDKKIDSIKHPSKKKAMQLLAKKVLEKNEIAKL